MRSAIRAASDVLRLLEPFSGRQAKLVGPASAVSILSVDESEALMETIE